MKCNIFLDDSPARVPGTILRAYEIWAEEGDGRWEKGWRSEERRVGKECTG